MSKINGKITVQKIATGKSIRGGAQTPIFRKPIPPPPPKPKTSNNSK